MQSIYKDLKEIRYIANIIHGIAIDFNSVGNTYIYNELKGLSNLLLESVNNIDKIDKENSNEYLMSVQQSSENTFKAVFAGMQLKTKEQNNDTKK
jgi:hypothetical protein